MNANNHNSQDGQAIYNAHDAKRDWYRLWLYIIVAATFIAILSVIWLGAGIAEYKDWASFLTVNIVS